MGVETLPNALGSKVHLVALGTEEVRPMYILSYLAQRMQ